MFSLGDFDKKSGQIIVSEPILVMSGFEAVQVAKQYSINGITSSTEGAISDVSNVNSADCT